jgi:hypothetical protein
VEELALWHACKSTFQYAWDSSTSIGRNSVDIFNVIHSFVRLADKTAFSFSMMIWHLM